MDSHRGWIHAFDPPDGLGGGVWAGLEVLLIGIFRNPVQILKVQRVFMNRNEMRAFVIQDTLRDPTKHALRIWGRKGGADQGWIRERKLQLIHLQTFSRVYHERGRVWQTEQVFQGRDEDHIQTASHLDKSSCRLYRCARHVPHGLTGKINRRTSNAPLPSITVTYRL